MGANIVPDRPSLPFNIWVIVMTFGERIRALREERGIKQKDLARELSLSASTIGMYEQNRREPDLETLTRMARYFECSLDMLTGQPPRDVPDSVGALSLREEELLRIWRRLDRDSRDIVIGEAKRALRNQQ